MIFRGSVWKLWWEFNTKNLFSTKIDLSWAGIKHLLFWPPPKEGLDKVFPHCETNCCKKWSHANLGWHWSYAVPSWSHICRRGEKSLCPCPPPWSASLAEPRACSWSFLATCVKEMYHWKIKGSERKLISYSLFSHWLLLIILNTIITSHCIHTV